MKIKRLASAENDHAVSQDRNYKDLAVATVRLHFPHEQGMHQNRRSDSSNSKRR